MDSHSPMRAVFSLLLISCATAPEKPTALGSSLPSPLSDQKPLPSLIEGRVAIVDLWASWCDPCKETLPKLVKLEQAYGAKELGVVGVSVGEPVDIAKSFADDAGLTYPIYVDPDFVFADSLEARQVPTILVFDKKGKIFARAHEIDRELLDLLKKLLEE